MLKSVFQQLSVRRVIYFLLVIVAVLGIVRRREIGRRLHFWRTGTLEIDGMVLYLNPLDRAITDAMLRDGSWEPMEAKALRQVLKAGDTFIDVGANIGYYTVIGSQAVGERGQVIAFEPEPESYSLLKRNIEANHCTNVTLEQKALSDKPGVMQLFVHDENRGAHSFFQAPGDQHMTKSIAVTVVTLDEYLEQNGLEPDFVKIDTEGAEPLILGGMGRTLEKVPDLRLIVEFSPYLLKRCQEDPSQFIDSLARQGFEFTQIDEADGRVTPSTPAKLLEQGLTNILLERRTPAAQPEPAVATAPSP